MVPPSIRQREGPTSGSDSWRAARLPLDEASSVADRHCAQSRLSLDALHRREGPRLQAAPRGTRTHPRGPPQSRRRLPREEGGAARRPALRDFSLQGGAPMTRGCGLGLGTHPDRPPPHTKHLICLHQGPQRTLGHPHQPPRETLAGDPRTGANGSEARGRDSLQHRPPPSVCSLGSGLRAGPDSPPRVLRAERHRGEFSRVCTIGPGSKRACRILQGGRRDCQRREKGNQSFTPTTRRPRGGAIPSLSVFPSSPHLYMDHKTQLPDTRCKAGQTEQAQDKAAVSCFLKISGLSVPLAFQSGDLQTEASECGLVERRVQDRAILADMQAQARPGSLPAGRRLPGVGAVEQL